MLTCGETLAQQWLGEVRGKDEDSSNQKPVQTLGPLIFLRAKWPWGSFRPGRLLALLLHGGDGITGLILIETTAKQVLEPLHAQFEIRKVARPGAALQQLKG